MPSENYQVAMHPIPDYRINSPLERKSVAPLNNSPWLWRFFELRLHFLSPSLWVHAPCLEELQFQLHFSRTSQKPWPLSCTVCFLQTRHPAPLEPGSGDMVPAHSTGAAAPRRWSTRAMCTGISAPGLLAARQSLQRPALFSRDITARLACPEKTKFN